MSAQQSKHEGCCKCKAHPCRCQPCGSQSSGGGTTTTPPWKATPQGSYLLIRYDPADTGVRPVPSGDVWWLSPDIWITGGDSLGNPIAGQSCIVNARIWNLGAVSAMPTSVQFSYIEPGLAIPITVPQPINAVPAYVLVPGGAYVEVGVPWTPPAAIGNVHTCLIVTCSCAVTGDVPAAPGNAVVDRHTGQHNVTLIGTQLALPFKFELTIRNLSPETAPIEVGARAMWMAADHPAHHLEAFEPGAMAGAVAMLGQAATRTQYRLLSRRASMLLEESRVVHIETLAQADLLKVVQASVGKPGRPLRAGQIVPPAGRVSGDMADIVPIVQPVALKSLEQATVHAEIAPPAHNDGFSDFVVHLFQMTRGSVDGGYSIVFRFGRKADRI
jgi:hypothetical protein